MIIQLNECIIELEEHVMNVFKKYIQYNGEDESGGILLGGYIPEENKYIITYASEPSDMDYRGATYFIRNQKNAQKIIDRLWTDSDGKINYLGEWHTHGCKNPYPSNTDRKLLKSLIKDKSNVWSELFMIILGNDGSFYLGMTNVKSKGKIVSEIQIGEELDAYIFNR